MPWIALAVLVACVVWLNVATGRRRARMTPAERAADDQEVEENRRAW